jgi:hypothetical protein
LEENVGDSQIENCGFGLYGFFEVVPCLRREGAREKGRL